MNASSLIDTMLPTLTLSTSIDEALEVMYDSKVSQLAVLNNGTYTGLISEDFLTDYPFTTHTLDAIPLQFSQVSVKPTQHIFEIIQLVEQYQLQTVAVVDHQSDFVGSIVVADLYRQFSKLLGVVETGAVIVLKINQRDYSLSEISRLVESNGVKIVSTFFSTNYSEDYSENSTLTLKLNQTNISTILATLERFGYTVMEVYTEEPINSIDKERFDQLLRYLAT